MNCVDVHQELGLESRSLAVHRFAAMDALRGFAALWVTAFHFNEVIPYKANPWTSFCKIGWLGVPIFFVISGWCMASLTERQRQAGAFIVARAIRIFIPYWCSLGVVVCIVAMHVLLHGVNDVTPLPETLFEILATVSLATSPASNVPTINWVYWTLTIELTFYLFVFAGLVVNRPNVGIWALLLFNYVVTWREDLATLFYFGPHAGIFCLGYFAHSRGAAREWGKLLFVSAVSLAPVYFANRLNGGTHSVVNDGVLNVLAGAVTAIALVGARSGHSARIPGAMLQIGQISYSIYLLHVPVGVYGILYWRSGWLYSPLMHFAYDSCAIALVVLAARLFYGVVEKPSHKMAKDLAKAWRFKFPVLATRH